MSSIRQGSTIALILLALLGAFTFAGTSASSASSSGGGTVFHSFVFFFPGVLIVVTQGDNLNYYSPIALTCTQAFASVNTAPTGNSANINILKNGATILSGDLMIAAGTLTASQTISVSVAQNDIITFNIDQVGGTISGSDLAVQVRCNQ